MFYGVKTIAKITSCHANPWGQIKLLPQLLESGVGEHAIIQLVS